ncbi:MAG: hypothetical protein Q4D98_03520 [Planctomycetia bacterium]|nr:hypothetical protein [Planctomycetia bacterium]
MTQLELELLAAYNDTFVWAGETLTYSPADTSQPAFTLRAIRGNALVETFGEVGKRLAARGLSFGIFTSSLPGTPKKMDRLTDSAGRQYDVVERGGKTMEYNDPYMILARLHVLERKQHGSNP